MADSKLTALSELSVPAFEDLTYAVDDPSGTPVSNKLTLARVMGMGGFLPGGRLTLTTGTPVTTSDVTSAGTLYYTPYLHNRIRVWDGTRWLYKTFAEISLSLTLTSGKNYDVFVDDDAATLVLSAAWTNDTTRADALGTQDSVTVLNSDKTKLWLGTIRASGSNVTEDSVTKRFVWNAYNWTKRKLKITDTTASWTYNSATWRQARATSSNKVEAVNGAAGPMVKLRVNCYATSGSSIQGMASIGVDWSSGFSAADTMEPGAYSASGYGGPCANLDYYPAAGYHTYVWIEACINTNTATFYSGAGSDGSGIAGMLGWIEG